MKVAFVDSAIVLVRLRVSHCGTVAAFQRAQADKTEHHPGPAIERQAWLHGGHCADGIGTDEHVCV